DVLGVLFGGLLAALGFLGNLISGDDVIAPLSVNVGLDAAIPVVGGLPPGLELRLVGLERGLAGVEFILGREPLGVTGVCVSPQRERPIEAVALRLLGLELGPFRLDGRLILVLDFLLGLFLLGQFLFLLRDFGLLPRQLLEEGLVLFGEGGPGPAHLALPL